MSAIICTSTEKKQPRRVQPELIKASDESMSSFMSLNSSDSHEKARKRARKAARLVADDFYKNTLSVVMEDMHLTRKEANEFIGEQDEKRFWKQEEAREKKNKARMEAEIESRLRKASHNNNVIQNVREIYHVCKTLLPVSRLSSSSSTSSVDLEKTCEPCPETLVLEELDKRDARLRVKRLNGKAVQVLQFLHPEEDEKKTRNHKRKVVVLEEAESESETESESEHESSGSRDSPILIAESPRSQKPSPRPVAELKEIKLPASTQTHTDDYETRFPKLMKRVTEAKESEVSDLLNYLDPEASPVYSTAFNPEHWEDLVFCDDRQLQIIFKYAQRKKSGQAKEADLEGDKAVICKFEIPSSF